MSVVKHSQAASDQYGCYVYLFPYYAFKVHHRLHEVPVNELLVGSGRSLVTHPVVFMSLQKLAADTGHDNRVSVGESVVERYLLVVMAPGHITRLSRPDCAQAKQCYLLCTWANVMMGTHSRAFYTGVASSWYTQQQASLVGFCAVGVLSSSG